MKKYFLFVVLSFIGNSIMAQDDKWPDSLNITLPAKDGNIFYEEVVIVDSSTKDQLYNVARSWFSNNFRSAKTVLDLDDRNAGKLIGKGILSYRSIQKTYGERLAGITIDITVKDGKYRVQLTDVKDLSEGDKITGEKFGDLNTYNAENLHPEKKQKFKAKFKYATLSGFDAAVKTLFISLKTAMIKNIRDDF